MTVQVLEIYADDYWMQPSVLVIEDSASVRRLIDVCLRPIGADMRFAEDGLIGLDAARKMVPDAIILDIGLPGLDGWEVLSQLRSAPETVDIRVLVLTAHAQPEMADRAAAGGADAFMTKPFRPSDLRDSVEALLADVTEASPAESLEL
ncbi:MAG: response regulator [Actinomycetota bacterium]|nr:response regulator [Actinomycetota bacterium]